MRTVDNYFKVSNAPYPDGIFPFLEGDDLSLHRAWQAATSQRDFLDKVEPLDERDHRVRRLVSVWRPVRASGAWSGQPVIGQ